MTRTALVTGANGHLGYNLALHLNEAGWHVRCSVRDALDTNRTRHLRAAGLEDIVEVDVRDEAAFQIAANGIDTLFHVAATFRYWTAEPKAQEELVRDAREGAVNAVRSAARAGVRKLVLTSSTVAVPFAESPDEYIDESAWQGDLRQPYIRAKTEAEREAWAMSEQLGVPMVAILPGAILGPGFQRRTPSTEIIENIMLGNLRMARPNSNFPAVDVRDVARAHLMAAETDCKGRFIVCNDHLPNYGELIEAMRRIDPSVPRSLMTMPDFMLPAAPFFEAMNARFMGTRRVVTRELAATMRGKWWNFSNARAGKELVWRPEIPLDDTLVETMSRIREIWREEGSR